MSTSDDAELVDAITAALARVRGRRHPGAHRHPGEHGHPHDPRDQQALPGPDARDARAGGRPMRGMGPLLGPRGMGGLARARLLEALAAATEPLSINEIADAVGVDQPRASRLVQQALLQEFVEREVDPLDARRSRVRLTPTGERMAKGMRGERRDSIRTALADFSTEERIEFARLLEKFADAWPERRGPDGRREGR